MQNNINIDYLLQNMPEDIYQAMLDYDINNQIKSLIIALGLSETASSIFFKEISNVLMGIKTIDDFKNTLITQLNLNETLANFAITQLNTIVFNSLENSILYMQNIFKKQTANATNNITNIETDKQNINNIQTPSTTQSYEQNMEQILNVIKNLSQKQVSNPSAIISEPTIVKEASPDMSSNNITKIDTANINTAMPQTSMISTSTQQSVPINNPNEILKDRPATNKKDKPNKLLKAMEQMQTPKTKIENLIQSYHFNTNTNLPNNNTQEQQSQDIEFESPFKIKKTPSIIQKGESETNNTTHPIDINPADVPDILKMKKMREPIAPSIKNIDLESPVNNPNISQTPIKYKKITTQPTNPYQYEQGSKNTAQTKFIDLSNT